ncbi:hypothetical protein DVA67_004780 [Solirubrobacter sp. CPCC 204708]|uniref:DUF4878 domain-containing protein n=1 Tax=Solirubrobacter deserti TaxID=2282478 RepID=A0ABT4RHY2_9ACTN|nr:hypothetical protein [Solirubrobacter deserti]MBE2315277.1 hypothetical protein [Solirubrobacter deserti]MDA0137961.1 hypothetical protein [Solirubrobacter deserti]
MTATFEPAPSFPPAPAPAPKRRWGRIALIVGGVMIATLAAIVVALVLFVNASTKDAQKVSDQLVTAVQTGDAAKAYALGGADFRTVATEADVKAIVEQISPLVTREPVSPNGKSINASTDRGKVAVFTYKLDGNGRAPVYFQTQIQETDGAWRVLSFRSADNPFSTELE